MRVCAIVPKRNFIRSRRPARLEDAELPVAAAAVRKSRLHVDARAVDVASRFRIFRLEVCRGARAGSCLEGGDLSVVEFQKRRAGPRVNSPARGVRILEPAASLEKP